MDNHLECNGARKSNHQQANSSPPTASAAAISSSTTALTGAIATILNLLGQNDSDSVIDSSNYPTAPLFDSAASHHCINDVSLFKNCKSRRTTIRLANQAISWAKSCGKRLLYVAKNVLDLRDALFVPTMPRYLISAARIARNFDILLRFNDFTSYHKVQWTSHATNRLDNARADFINSSHQRMLLTPATNHHDVFSSHDK